jgi:hypothetical protein
MASHQSASAGIRPQVHFYVCVDTHRPVLCWLPAATAPRKREVAMPDAEGMLRNANENAWKALTLQTDTMLKLSRRHTEVWRVVVGAMAAGGALVAATAALTVVFLCR